jgi:hypothetical protein
MTLAYTIDDSVVQYVAENMTCGILRARTRAAKERKGDGERIEGVLVGVLRKEVQGRLDGVFERRGGYVRGIGEVEVEVEGGGVVRVSAWVYRKVE